MLFRPFLSSSNEKGSLDSSLVPLAYLPILLNKRMREEVREKKPQDEKKDLSDSSRAGPSDGVFANVVGVDIKCKVVIYKSCNVCVNMKLASSIQITTIPPQNCTSLHFRSTFPYNLYKHPYVLSNGGENSLPGIRSALGNLGHAQLGWHSFIRFVRIQRIFRQEEFVQTTYGVHN